MRKSQSEPEPIEPEQENTSPAPAEEKVELRVVDSVEEEQNSPPASVQKARFAPLEPGGSSAGSNTMDLLLDVQLELSVELGRASMSVKDVLQLGAGSVVELNKLGGEPVDILVNGRPIARGEVVVVDENFGVRVTEIISKGHGVQLD